MYHRVSARAALADLRIQQGALDEAERLLLGLDDHAEVVGPLARLHLARGEFVLAASVGRRGVRMLGSDRVRAAPLLAVVAEAELGIGDLEAAAEAAERAMELAAGVDVPSLGATAALGKAKVEAAIGSPASAIRVLHEALRRLGSHEVPALRVPLH
jgi:tetratricopeptide (TPR) repeat protein